MTFSIEATVLLCSVLVKGVAVLGLTAGIAWLIRERDAAYRHAVWALGLGFLLLLPLGEIGLPQWSPSAPWPAVSSVSSLVANERDAPAHRAATRTGRSLDLALPKKDATSQAGAERSSRTNHPKGPSAQPVPVEGPFGEKRASADVPSSSPSLWVYAEALGLDRPRLLLLWTWAVGAVSTLVWIVTGLLRARWWLRRAERVDGTPWTEVLARARSRIEVRRVRLFLSPDVEFPVTMGFFRPAILLPVRAEEWPEERLRTVLLHELAHARRGDWATNLIGRLACAMHWPNPLVWHAAGTLRDERERACDRRVLAAGLSGVDYADHLVTVARQAVGTTVPKGALAMARPSELKKRVESILSAPARGAGLSLSRGVALGVLMGMLTLPLLAVGPVTTGISQDASRDSDPSGRSGSAQPVLHPPGLRLAPLSSPSGPEAGPSGLPVFDPVASDEKNDVEQSQDQHSEEQRSANPSPANEPASAHAPSSQRSVRRAPTEDGSGTQTEDTPPSDERRSAKQSAGEQTGGPGNVQPDTSDDAQSEQQRHELQTQAIYAIGDLPSNRAVPKLLDVARTHPRPELRAHAVQELEDHGSQDVISALTSIARSDSVQEVQIAALETLGDVYDDGRQTNEKASVKKHVQRMRRLALEIENKEVAAYAIHSIGETNADTAIPALTTVANSDGPMEVRRAAVQALGEVDDPRAAEALVRIVGEN